MLLSDLPSDVLDDIANSVAVIDGHSVRSLALVSQAFRRPSQRRLFASITLIVRLNASYDPLIPPRQHVLLRDILKENPVLATYTLALQCVQFDTSQWGRLGLSDLVSGSANQWMLDHGVLVAEILQLLAASPIQALTVFNGPVDNLLDWSTLHPSLQASFLRLFSIPTLLFVSLSGFSLPRNIFNTFIDLKRLILGNFGWSSDNVLSPSDIHVIGQRIHRLSSLCLEMSTALPIESIGSGIGLDLSELSILTLNISTIPPPNLVPFISVPNLKKLTISILCPAEEGHDGLYLDLGLTIALRDLILSCETNISVKAFSWIDLFLSTLPANSPIENFSLKLKIYRDPFTPTDFGAFDVLGKALARLHHGFIGIKKIQLKMDLHCPMVKMSPEVVQQFWEQMRENLLWKGCEDVLILQLGTSTSS
ncbi:hypothetical protein BDN72DRAFT_843755 [Pluteus cervinus]|uniref:Uncharacterized protein n=1 Tax=Pluteus cervinus TaxID=181527 RepID=A0ACD3ANL0_9AGAR|nr:hypothetical protein BDN72DRAFT_843755 [Pluteus cervinus]